MKNIERFNLYTAHILATLYETFPVSKQLQAGEIVVAMKAVVPFANEKDQRDLNGFVGQTLLWLTETGYLLQRGGTSPFRYVLSPKAFEAMNAALPDALSKKEGKGGAKTVGEKLTEVAVDTAKETGTETKSQVIAQLVGQVIGWAMKTLSGP